MAASGAAIISSHPASPACRNGAAVAAIVPARNEEGTIAAVLRSLMAQTIQADADHPAG
jgi:hypothetical protein